MQRFRLLYVALLCIMMPTLVFASTVTAHSFYSATLGRNWSYLIYLPSGYHANKPRYPTLYLLHGNKDNAHDWISQGNLQRTVDQMIAAKAIPPVIIVMPQGDTSWYVDRKERIESAFFKDLLPEITLRYAASEERTKNVIGGISMGGFGALRYALIAPDRFCAVLLLSPAIYVGAPPLSSGARYANVFGTPQFDLKIWHALNYPSYWQPYFNQPYRLAMFIAAGDADLVIQAEADLLYTRLRQAGNPAALRIVGGGHTWDFWRHMLEFGLAYTLRCVKP